MKVGDIVYTKNLTAHLGPPGFREQYRESWHCKKGFLYVLGVIAIEERDKPIDGVKELQRMGWKRDETKRQKKATR